MKKKEVIKQLKKTIKSFLNTLPIMFSVMLIIGLFKAFISFENISNIFTGVPIIDTIFGSLSGSILAGNVVNSYILGEEMLKANISLFAVTAFLVSWVTVGFVQIPAEKKILGTKFTVLRNIVSVILAAVISLFTVFTLGVIS